MRVICCLLFSFGFVNNQIDSLTFSHPSVQPMVMARENSTSSACKVVSPDVRACGLRGQPVGNQKRRIYPFPMPWVPVWITGVGGRGVISSRRVTNEKYEMSGKYTSMKDSVESQ